MTRTADPSPPTAVDTAPDQRTGGADESDASLSLTESVATSVTGMVIGGAALWVLAPICFSC